MEIVCKFCLNKYDGYEGNFHHHSTNKSGYNGRCKSCQSEWNKEYNKTHNIKEQRRGYYLKNKSKNLKRSKLRRGGIKQLSRIDFFEKITNIGGYEFTDNMLDIIFCICNEMISKEMAEKLSLNINTVDRLRSDIYDIIECRNSVGVVRFCYDYDLIEPLELKTINYE